MVIIGNSHEVYMNLYENNKGGPLFVAVCPLLVAVLSLLVAVLCGNIKNPSLSGKFSKAWHVFVVFLYPSTFKL